MGADGNWSPSLPLGSWGKSLGKGWAAPCPQGGGDAISVIAPKCPQDETFPTMNSKGPPFGIPFVKGVEEKACVCVCGGGVAV